MAFEVEFAFEAEADLDAMRPYYRRALLDAIEQHLQQAPMYVGRSRIKRLRQVSSPAYRLRVGEYRVFYDVDETACVVTVLRVLSKPDALRYLEEVNGESDVGGQPGIRDE